MRQAECGTCDYGNVVNLQALYPTTAALSRIKCNFRENKMSGAEEWMPQHITSVEPFWLKSENPLIKQS